MSNKKAKAEQSKGSTSSDNLSRTVYLVVSVILLIIGFRFANELKWYGDDCFITLRYIDNWVEGKGLVYNEGERVEGYTHFLWMVLIAFFKWMGFNSLTSALNLGLVCYLFTLLVFARFSWKLQKPFSSWVVPFTLVTLISHHHFNAFATSGLETMMFTMWLSLLIYVLFLSEFKRILKLSLSGVIIVFLITTRPDGALIFILFNILLLVFYVIYGHNWKRIITDGLFFNLPMLILFGPFLLWRFSYYGSIVPNTYYAKAGYFNQWEKGWIFISQYFHVYNSSWIWIPAATLILGLFLIKNKGLWGLRDTLKTNIHFQLGFTFLAILLLYGIGFVWKVGGDFMFSRFMIPLVPIMYGLAEIAILTWWSYQKKFTYLPVSLIALVVVYIVLRGGDEERRLEFTTQDNNGRLMYKINDNIVDERMFYKDLMPRITYWGKYLAPYFEGLPVKVLNSGQCAFAYYGRFNTVIEKFGLTDSTIAHQEVSREDLGRIGHSKAGSYEYFIERGVHFSFYRSPYKAKEYRFVQFILPDGSPLQAEMFIYDKTLMQELKNRFGNNIRFTDASMLVDQVIANYDNLPAEDKKELLTELDEFYFSVNSDEQTKTQRQRLASLMAQNRE